MGDQENSSEIQQYVVTELNNLLKNPPDLMDEKNYKKWFTMMLGAISSFGRDTFKSSEEIAEQLYQARENWTHSRMSLDPEYKAKSEKMNPHSGVSFDSIGNPETFDVKKIMILQLF